MGRRRVGGNSRVLRKKKLKISKKNSRVEDASSSNATSFTVKRVTQMKLRKPGARVSSGKQRTAALEALRKERSQLLKQQAAERMVLKEHLRELEVRRQRIRKGENAKVERRELGKYIRQLRAEQKKKHEAEVAAVEEAVRKHGGKKGHDISRDADEWEDVEDDAEEFDESELQSTSILGVMSSTVGGTLSEAAAACRTKMQAAGVNDACIRTFLAQHAFISSGEDGNIPECTISPVESLDSLEHLTVHVDPSLLSHVVVLKLNGGLGTGMGLSTAKSLLPVKDGKTFLDFTVLQVEHLRKRYSEHLCFMLMNSFSTSSDTKNYLKKYKWLYDTFDTEVELMQNRVPKIREDNLFPVSYEAEPSCEWAPPGHGDIYTALYGSGKLDSLIHRGYKYMFVSNSDNLGATLDARLVAYMEANKLEFLMEVCRRTDSDKKGGHLAYQNISVGGATEPSERRFILRESAQCPKEDESSFQDIEKHRFFNTNNLWVNLVALKKTMESHAGTLPLPVIRNAKTVNPADGASTKVYQLEMAMGAAIGLFKHTAAVVVPRERFAPVKTCSDLLALRSDAYVVTEDERIVLCKDRAGVPPTIELDNKHYKMISGFDKLVKCGVPSLRQCSKLTVQGSVEFTSGVVVKGEVVIRNTKEESLVIEHNRVLNNEVVNV